MGSRRSIMETEQITVKGRDYTRTVWFLAGPKQASHALCVFLDGEYYLEKVGALAILDKAIASGRIPSMSFVFVPSNGPQSRHEDFICNDQYARFVAIGCGCAQGRRRGGQASRISRRPCVRPLAG